MKTAAVFFGGKSNEHDISVITGMYAVNLLKGKYRVVPVYLPVGGGMKFAKAETVEAFRVPDPAKFVPCVLEGRELISLKKHKKICRIDCALNCCHGGAGEDGTLSALLKWNGVPSASPDTAGSAIFMNKEYACLAAKGMGIPVPPFTALREGDEISASDFEFPVIVKPARLGSSIGIKVAKDFGELKSALETAFMLDGSVLVQKYLPHKRDINCAAYLRGGKVITSEPEEVFSDEEILSFGEKYEGKGGRASAFPAELPAETAQKIRSMTERIYRTYAFRGVVRADFLISEGEVYFNELNTVPGSLAAYLFTDSLSSARDFLVSLIEEAGEEKEKLVLSTGILNKPWFSGGKGHRK